MAYAGTVDVSYSGVDYTANVNFSNDVMEVNLISPEILKGLCLEVTKEEISVKNESFNFGYDKDVISDFCPITYLYDVLLAVNEQKPTFIQQNEILFAEFSVENHRCEVSFDKATKKLIEVRYDKYVYNFKA